MSPLLDAIAKLDRRTPVGAALRTAEWDQVDEAIRARSFFSSTLTNAQVLAEAKRRLSDSVALRTEEVGVGKRALVDRSSFIGDLKKLVGDLGLSDGSGGLTDLASSKRLGLIFDQNTEEAYGFARRKSGLSEGALAAFPAQELVRLESRKTPRDWTDRWVSAGGQLVGGRMVALKTEPIWTEISRFGTPWPPFDFGSGMGVQDIDYDEAVALGLLTDGDLPAPTDADIGFNSRLEGSTDGLQPSILDSLFSIFGDAAEVVDGALRWRGSSA